VVAVVGVVVVSILVEGAYEMWSDADTNRIAAESEAPTQIVQHITAGRGGDGHSAGGGGSVAIGPGAVAKGGEGGRGFTLWEAFARSSWDSGMTVKQLVENAGLTRADLDVTYGAGGDGGSSSG
jgi:hypothetical protein